SPCAPRRRRTWRSRGSSCTARPPTGTPSGWPGSSWPRTGAGAAHGGPDVRGGSRLLAGGLVAAWAAVYLVTRVLVAPPLGVLPTLASGLVVSTVVVLGYPSALRGPRGGSLAGPAAHGRSW